MNADYLKALAHQVMIFFFFLLANGADEKTADTLRKIQLDFAKQLKSGVVIIPPYFDAELIKVPDNVEVIIQGKEK